MPNPQPPEMLKPVIASVVSQITATVSLSICLAIGAVAAAFGIYEALRLAMPAYAASGLLALLFFAAAGALMAWLHKSHQEKERAPPPRFGLSLIKDLALAGAVTFISAAGIRRR
jgi:EamA domain-containing membrane protein RarD